MKRTFLPALSLLLCSAALAVADDRGAGAATAAPAAAAASIASGAAAPTAAAGAAVPGTGDQAKTLRGMAVLGNNEAPMSLFIVPWKSSELGTEAELHRSLDERDVPVDRDVFLREVEFYQVSVGGKK